VKNCDSTRLARNLRGAAESERGVPPSRRGFTLIELLAVLAIMGIMMTGAVVAFLNFGKNAAMRSSVLNVRSGLSFARQYTVTHRVRTRFNHGNLPNDMGVPCGWYSVTTNNVTVGTTNFLQGGVTFGGEGFIEFKLDGSCTGNGTSTNITLIEQRRGDVSIVSTTMVYMLTGRVKSLVWGEQ
jgi:prepilin-type N-terminal cleavage/methylation domain-containing protein